MKWSEVISPLAFTVKWDVRWAVKLLSGPGPRTWNELGWVNVVPAARVARRVLLPVPWYLSPVIWPVPLTPCRFSWTVAEACPFPASVKRDTWWRVPSSRTFSPAPPFAHGTNWSEENGTISFVIVVVAEECRTAGSRVDGARGWPESLQAASRTTERKAKETRGMERSLEGGNRGM